MEGADDPAQPATPDAQVLADFASWGIDTSTMVVDEDMTEVWDINWPSLLAFLDCRSCWRIVAGGFARPVRTGLDYASAAVVIGRRNRRRARRLLDDIRVMERAALEAFGEIAANRMDESP